MKKFLLNIIIIIVSAIILIVLAFFTSDVKKVYEIMSHARYYWLVPAFGCMFVYWLLDAVILRLISLSMCERLPFFNILRVTMIGQFFGCVTPFGSGSQPAQIYVLVKDGVKPGHAASVAVTRALLHQLIIVIYTLFAFIFKKSMFGDRVPEFYLLFFAGFLINIAFLVFYSLFFFKKETAIKILLFLINIIKNFKIVRKKYSANLDGIKDKIESEVTSFRDGAVAILNKPYLALKMVALQFVQYTFFFSIPYFIHLAVEKDNASLVDMIAAQSLISMIQLLVPTPGSIGGAEGTSYLFFGMFFSASIVPMVILMGRIITFYSSIILGGFFSALAPEKPLKNK